MLLTKDNYKDINKPKYKIVEFDGFEVKLKALNLEGQLAIEKKNIDKENSQAVVYEMLKLCCVDEEDNLVFDDEVINSLNSNIALKLFDECLKLNNLDAGVDMVESKAKN